MQIGVAGTDRQEEEDWIMDAIADRGHTAVFIDPSDVSYALVDGELSATHGDTNLTELDVVLMRRTRFDVAASRDLIAALDAANVRTVERKDIFYNPLSKFYSLLQFTGKTFDAVDIPATGIVRTADMLAPVADRIGYPLVLKPVAGREGEGVDRIDTADALPDTMPDEELPVLVQEYLDIDEEYRILVVGDEALGTVVKESDDDDAVARNYAQGAEFNPVDRPALEDAAVEIAQTLGIEVAGVDIARTTDGDHFEIECNRCPQFTGFQSAYPDIDVGARIAAYLEEQRN